MKYQILEAESAKELVKEINRLTDRIKEYKGGPFIVNHKVCQAVIFKPDFIKFDEDADLNHHNRSL